MGGQDCLRGAVRCVSGQVPGRDASPPPPHSRQRADSGPVRKRPYHCNAMPCAWVTGHWLVGHGVAYHLIETRTPEQRQTLWGARLEHFEAALPNCDHLAFLVRDFVSLEEALKARGVPYRIVRVGRGLWVSAVVWLAVSQLLWLLVHLRSSTTFLAP